MGTAPIHEHIYYYGFICLSILDKDWSPALKTSSVCMSIISMMSSAIEKRAPHGDGPHSRHQHLTSPK